MRPETRFPNRFHLACLGLALLATLPFVAAAQEEAVFGDRVDVELVLVDVFVASKDGQPVTDLTAEDFQLFHDGRPVPISQFTAPSPITASTQRQPSSGSPAQAASRVAGEPRRLVIFLDELHLHPVSRGRLMRTLFDDLQERLSPTDEVMVASYGGGRATVLLPMTTNRSSLKRVLREQGESGAVSLLAYNDSERILEMIERRHSEETLTSGVAGDACVDLGGIAHAHAQSVHNRVMGTIFELERFVNSLAGYDGRKVLLHVSDGIPLVPGAEAYRFASELCDGTGAAKGLDNAIDTELMGNAKYTRWDPTTTAATLQEFNTTDEWTRLAGQANTYQVSFYMFQASMGTNRAGASSRLARTSYSTEFEGRRNQQDALFMVADETGGRAVLDANGVTLALDQMSEDWRSGYQLAYEPPSPGDGRRHRVRVEVDRPGTRLRHRKSYLSKRPDERIADRVLSTLIHGPSQASNPLDLKIGVESQTPAERDITNFRLRVRVPLDQLVLLADESVRRGLFTVFVAASGDHGQLTPVGQKDVPLRLPIESSEREYVYAVEIPIRGAEGHVAIAVQDQLGGEISYVREKVRTQKSS